MIDLDSSICSDFKPSSWREWLETNGIGGYACGTVSGANTRRYHGVLTAAAAPPLGRLRMVSKIEETLTVDGTPYEISANQYPGKIYPQGYLYIKRFRLDPFPIWTYEVAGLTLEKKIFMVHGENTTICQWRIVSGQAGGNVWLEVRPLVSLVDYHHMRHQDDGLDITCDSSDGTVKLTSNSQAPPLYVSHSGGSFATTGLWYRNFEYEIEKERGFDSHEDLYQPFSLSFDTGTPVSVLVSTEVRNAADAAGLERRETTRRKKLIARSSVKSEFGQQLVLAADQFIVTRGAGDTVIAGYPWFTDWGRDTMIALPGLALAAGRPNTAKGILLEFSRHISEGMLPNRFADADGEAEYNTVDATLWYFEAVRAYLVVTGEFTFVHVNLYKKLADIIAWHVRGTRYGIGVDSDGLLTAGEEGVQLTWMDAKVGDHVITPRTGKAVEIQALWFNALMIMASLAETFGDSHDHARYLEMADKCKRSFNAQFWNESEACLFDVVNQGERDGSVRPNQIFAVSLHYSMLDDDTARKVVDKVRSELLTPYGLRSLSPNDPKYIPLYVGSPLERDSAYHQGTVWAWLIGGFIDAYRRVYPDKRDEARGFLRGFHHHLSEAGLGQISEIFDGRSPHSPRGCFAQAWSVAEVLRTSIAIGDEPSQLRI